MMQVIPRWKIEFSNEHGVIFVEFYIHDNHLNNVLRKIADLDFDVKRNWTWDNIKVVISQVKQ